MKRLQLEVGEVILRDPAVEAFGSQIGTTGNSAQTGNTGRFDIILKPIEERGITASQVIDRLRPELAKLTGVKTYLQPSQDITVGGRTVTIRSKHGSLALVQSTGARRARVVKTKTEVTGGSR